MSFRQRSARLARSVLHAFASSQEIGLVIVLLLVTVALTLLAGSHADRRTGEMVNAFFNAHTLVQTATDASFFAIMAIGATMVIISGGIDLSVGSIYALAGVTMALEEGMAASRGQHVDVIALDEALDRLTAMDPQQGRVVELRYFSGLSVEETAEVLGVSSRTVKRDWNVAKAWLRHELSRGGSQRDA